MNKSQYHEKSPKSIQEAIDAIYDAFWWDGTPEGNTYWNDVINKLSRHRAEAEKELGQQSILQGGASVFAPNAPDSVLIQRAEPESNQKARETCHIYYNGRAICGSMPSDVTQWPKGHMRVGPRDSMSCNCKPCLSKLTPEMLRECGLIQ